MKHPSPFIRVLNRLLIQHRHEAALPVKENKYGDAKPREVSGLTYREISRMEDVPEKDVDSHLRWALSHHWPVEMLDKERLCVVEDAGKTLLNPWRCTDAARLSDLLERAKRRYEDKAREAVSGPAAGGQDPVRQEGASESVPGSGPSLRPEERATVAVEVPGPGSPGPAAA